MARFDDATITRAYSVRSMAQGATTWKTVGRTWANFGKAINHAHKVEALPYMRGGRVQVVLTETTTMTVFETAPPPESP